jgi:flagellin
VNDTNSESDRKNINDEIGKLQDEITRISETSTFNNKKLIDGSMTESIFQVGHKTGETISVGLENMSSLALGKSTTADKGDIKEITFAGELATTNQVVVTLTTDDTGTKELKLVGAEVVTGAKLAAALNTAFQADVNYSGYTFSVDGNVLTVANNTTGSNADTDLADGDFTLGVAYETSTTSATAITTMEDEQVDTQAAANGTAAGTSISAVSVTNGTKAAEAITAIDYALQSVGEERAKLGAFQNRLTHAVNNMTNMSANTAAAKSIIADADYAAESSSLAKNQILQQAGTAMLAQANAQAQSVLSLLK